MDADKDYYATLGLTPSADAVVVRAAYKALAQRYHPDKVGVAPDTAGLRMAELNEAYGILSDPAKRAEYDRLREKMTQSADTAFADGGLDHNSGLRRSVRAADPPACAAPVGSAVRTDDLAVSAVAGIMTEAARAERGIYFVPNFIP